MRYGQIRQYDIANGEGIRTSIFVTGCTHNCFNCFNKEYQDFKAGDIWTKVETDKIISYLNDDNISGLTILGGEPFQNTIDLTDIIKQVKAKVSKNIWVYSGYTWEEILTDKCKLDLLKLCDVLVDGRYVEELRDPSLEFRGSSNQRIIDIQNSLKNNEIILHLK